MLTKLDRLGGSRAQFDHFLLEQLALGLHGALDIIEKVQERVGLFVLAGHLELEHIELAAADQGISLLDLVEQRSDLDEQRARCHSARVGRDQFASARELVGKLGGKGIIVGLRLGNDFLVGNGCVQSAKPALEGQSPPQAELMNTRNRFGEGHILVHHRSKLLFGAGDLPKQKASQANGEQQQEEREAEDLGSDGSSEAGHLRPNWVLVGFPGRPARVSDVPSVLE